MKPRSPTTRAPRLPIDPDEARFARDAALERATAEHYLDPVLYDHEYRRRRADVNHYRRLAAELLPPGAPSRDVLELGCGSGRLLVPLARDGLRVVGVDLSMPMLARCASRLARLPGAPRQRALLVRADFRRLAVARRFPLVLCPFNAMQHLYTRTDVESFLDVVRAHLAPGGTFAFDVMNPDLKWLVRDPDKRWARTRFKDPRTGSTYYYSTSHFYDPTTQINWIRLFYDLEDLETRSSTGGEGDLTPPMVPAGAKNQVSERIRRGKIVHLAQRQFFPEELVDLLHYNGFSVERREGGFGGEPFDSDSDSQVCRCSIRSPNRR